MSQFEILTGFKFYFIVSCWFIVLTKCGKKNSTTAIKKLEIFAVGIQWQNEDPGKASALIGLSYEPLKGIKYQFVQGNLKNLHISYKTGSP